MKSRKTVLLLVVLGVLAGVSAWVVDQGEASGKILDPTGLAGDMDPGGHGSGPPKG